MAPVIYRPAAELELQDAYRWYEGCSVGLGRDFMACVDDRVQVIRKFPQAYPVVHQEIRRAVIRRFPYSLFYLPTPQAIIVLSVFHSSRKPINWKRAD
jgi:plasmid stabilization system protein ParE